MVKKLLLGLLLSVLVLSSVFVGGTKPVAAIQACGDITTVTLVAGQHIESGTVTVWNDATNLYVKYATTGGWYLAETHVAVATTLDGIPQKNGNAAPGQFPYKTIHDPVVTEYTYVIPLAPYVAGTQLFVATHASVVLLNGGQIVDQQTGWGNGDPFPGKNWGMYFNFTVQACDEDPQGGCTLTQGYWRTHSIYGPAPYDATWANVGEDTPFFNTGKTWYNTIWMASRGDTYYILARQYIAAVLNGYAGASAPAEVTAAVTEASTWLATHSAPVKPATPAGQDALRLATLLDNYNNGLIGPGHCDQ